MTALPREPGKVRTPLGQDSMHATCGAIDGANNDKGETGNPIGEDGPDLEEANIDDLASTVAVEGVDVQAAERRRRKSKKPPKSQKNITGFEGKRAYSSKLELLPDVLIEYYADAPMTPMQAAEKRKLYDP